MAFKCVKVPPKGYSTSEIAIINTKRILPQILPHSNTPNIKNAPTHMRRCITYHKNTLRGAFRLI